MVGLKVKQEVDMGVVGFGVDSVGTVDFDTVGGFGTVIGTEAVRLVASLAGCFFASCARSFERIFLNSLSDFFFQESTSHWTRLRRCDPFWPSCSGEFVQIESSNFEERVHFSSPPFKSS